MEDYQAMYWILNFLHVGKAKPRGKKKPTTLTACLTQLACEHSDTPLFQVAAELADQREMALQKKSEKGKKEKEEKGKEKAKGKKTQKAGKKVRLHIGKLVCENEM